MEWEPCVGCEVVSFGGVASDKGMVRRLIIVHESRFPILL